MLIFLTALMAFHCALKFCNFLLRLKAAYNRLGTLRFIAQCGRKILQLPNYFFRYAQCAIMQRNKFVYSGIQFEYFLHPYTWNTERAVELPVAHWFLRQNFGKHILEVGNVLSHYYPVSHDVVDKYEPGIRVINSDIVTFVPRRKYDVVVSVSTLEHVGYDEQPQNPNKVRTAFDNIFRNVLKPKGILFFTAPTGYNPFFDKYVRSLFNKSHAKLHFFLRTGNTSWREASWEKIRNAQYNKPFPCANAIVIGIVRNSQKLKNSSKSF